MARVLGIGGIFMTCADPAATTAWYTRVLGLEVNAHGGFDFLHRHSAAAFPEGARTILGVHAEGGDDLAPSTLPFMLNLIVDDLDAVLARARAEGTGEVQPRQSHDYGQFAWIVDPDGRKLELWQPPG